MKRNEHYYLRRISDTFFLIPSDDIPENEKKMVFLNETGAFLWRQMENEFTIDDLVKCISDQYSISEDTAYQHILEFISFLSKNECLI